MTTYMCAYIKYDDSKYSSYTETYLHRGLRLPWVWSVYLCAIKPMNSYKMCHIITYFMINNFIFNSAMCIPADVPSLDFSRWRGWPARLLLCLHAATLVEVAPYVAIE